MTPVFLLENLQRFIEEKTADIILTVRTRTGRNEVKERPAAVYKMGLPEADDAQQKVPYILVKFLTGTDDKAAGEPEEDSCKVRIIFAVYSENGQDGPLALLNLMLRVRSELKKAGAVGGGQGLFQQEVSGYEVSGLFPGLYQYLRQGGTSPSDVRGGAAGRGCGRNRDRNPPRLHER